jgi:hypothetical protein
VSTSVRAAAYADPPSPANAVAWRRLPNTPRLASSLACAEIPAPALARKRSIASASKEPSGSESHGRSRRIGRPPKIGSIIGGRRSRRIRSASGPVTNTRISSRSPGPNVTPA